MKPVKSVELSVLDGAGFTFAFEYQVSTRAAAISQFKKNCRRCGITKFKNIKILEVILHREK